MKALREKAAGLVFPYPRNIKQMPKKILIVDDEINLLELVKVNLEAAGFSVITAQDGEEGLKKTYDENPDLIILDIYLPGIDGCELCRRIKNDPRTKDMPVIFLTAATQKEDIKKAIDAGCDLFLSKPFDPLKLVEMAEKILIPESINANSKYKILVIDDDISIVELLEVNLKSAGYKVEIAFDGEMAMELIERGKFDLIILDIMIPKIDGYEICRRLRKKDTTMMTPVIVLSAKNKPVDKIAGLKLGADEYVTKPFDVEELITRVDSILKRTGHILSANPLTELPGNISIMQDVHQRLKNKEKFAFIYLDIDNFKAYNDKYGFEKGDEVIKFTAGIMKQGIGGDDFVGHIGGDDFILICNAEKSEIICQEIVDLFDKKIPQFYDIKDRERGFIIEKDRRGKIQEFPLMTLSIGITTNESEEMNHYGKIVEAATEMKKYAKLKEKRKSSFVKDKRK